MAHTSDVGYGFFAPPGMPTRFVTALRAAYQATLKDPGFIANAKKRKAPIGAASGEKLTKIVQDAVNTPPAIIERFRKLSTE
jgi:tripartite-type tricarboxylate transporter receptor subunit TctC